MRKIFFLGLAPITEAIILEFNCATLNNLMFNEPCSILLKAKSTLGV